MRKVRTDENLSDALTKHVTQEEINYHIQQTNQHIEEGRHQLAPEVSSVEKLISEPKAAAHSRPLNCDGARAKSIKCTGTLHPSDYRVRGGVQNYAISFPDCVVSGAAIYELN